MQARAAHKQGAEKHPPGRSPRWWRNGQPQLQKCNTGDAARLHKHTHAAMYLRMTRKAASRALQARGALADESRAMMRSASTAIFGRGLRPTHRKFLLFAFSELQISKIVGLPGTERPDLASSIDAAVTVGFVSREAALLPKLRFLADGLECIFVHHPAPHIHPPSRPALFLLLLRLFMPPSASSPTRRRAPR